MANEFGAELGLGVHSTHFFWLNDAEPSFAIRDVSKPGGGIRAGVHDMDIACGRTLVGLTLTTEQLLDLGEVINARLAAIREREIAEAQERNDCRCIHYAGDSNCPAHGGEGGGVVNGRPMGQGAINAN